MTSAPGEGNVSGFVRTGLFKRLSSSGHSFIVSLQRQRARNELFLHAIDNELPIPVGSFTDKQFAVSDEDVEDDPTPHGSLASRYEELRKNLPAKTKWINSTVFKRPCAKISTATTRCLRACLTVSAAGTRPETPR